MGACESKTGTCETSAAASGGHSESHCPCGGACGGDPMVCKMNTWMCSFHQAKKAVEVDILKAKISKLWGPKLEKEATVVLEAMEAKWKSMQAVGDFKEQLREKFEQICKENR